MSAPREPLITNCYLHHAEFGEVEMIEKSAYDALKAENAKLRAALVKIRDTLPLQDLAANYAWMLEQARQALDGGET